MTKLKMVSIATAVALILMPVLAASPQESQPEAAEPAAENVVVIDSSEIARIVTEALREAQAAVEAARVGETVRAALAEVDINAIVTESLREVERSLQEVDFDRIVRESMTHVDVDAIVAEALESAREALEAEGVRIEIRQKNREATSAPDSTPAP